MILEEDFQNLNIIDRSLLDELNLKKAQNFAPECEVIVDKVRDPHSFNTIMEIVKQEDVAAIVFRASRRQLMLIGYRTAGDFDRYQSSTFYVRFSDYAFDNITELTRYQQGQTVDSEAVVKTMISTAFLGFYGDDETAKKVWDILVIKKSDVSPLRQGREDSRKGMVKTPQDKAAYGAYIENLKNDLKVRLERYVDSKRPDIKNHQDVMDLFKTDKAIEKIRIDGEIYKLVRRSSSYDGKEMYLDYKLDKNNYEPKTNYEKCQIVIRFQGIYPIVKHIKFWENPNDSSDSNAMYFP